MSQGTEISILSLNCWGLRFVSKHRFERLSEIARRIATASPAYDLVCLQEFWVHTDYEHLVEQVRHVLPYHKFFNSGPLGSGLVILSKWEILETRYHRYTLNGRPTAFWRGDYYVGKGVASAAIRLPGDKRIMEVFNTHLHAPYEPHPHDSYLCHRTAQAWDIARLMRDAVRRGSVVVGMGDFNMTPSSLAHAIITTTGLVNDSWMTMYPNTPLKDHDPTRSAHYNLTTLGVTCDSVLNSWRIKDPIIPPPETADPRGQRLDYIFHSETTSHITAAKVGFTEPFKLPSGQIVSLSDHFSIEVTLVVKSAPHFPLLPAAAAGIKPQNEAQQLLVEVAEDSQDLKPFPSHTPATNEEVKSFYHPSPRYLPLDLITEIQSLIKMYTAREVQQSFWRIAHFWGSVVVLVALHVACWFWRTGGFLWVFLSWVVAVSGTLDGLIGWVFMKGELSALKEFEEEVERYKSVVIGEQGGNSMINNSRNGGAGTSNGRRVY